MLHGDYIPVFLLTTYKIASDIPSPLPIFQGLAETALRRSKVCLHGSLLRKGLPNALPSKVQLGAIVNGDLSGM